MDMVLTTDLGLLGPWAWKRMGSGEWFPQGKSALGEVNDDGNVRWAAIYDNYEPDGSIHIHIAIDNPKYVTRRAISSVFEYPFCQLGVKKVLVTVNSDNAKSMSFVARLGFRVEAVIEDAYDMGDMYILSMTLDECPWLRGREYGQECNATEAA